MNIDKIKNDPRMPKHIALIIDGNGRWAKQRGLPRSVGHKFGFENLKHILFSIGSIDISFLILLIMSFVFMIMNFIVIVLTPTHRSLVDILTNTKQMDTTTFI